MVTSSQTSSPGSSEVELFDNRINDTECEKLNVVEVVDRLQEDSAMRDGTFFISVFLSGRFSGNCFQ